MVNILKPWQMERYDKPQIIELCKITDPRGNLSVIQKGQGFPFDIKRIFFLYDVPADSERGGHAHHGSHQLLIAIAGSFEVELDNGAERRRYTLNRPYRGLLIPPGFWRTMDNFSAGSVCLVVTDTEFDEADYIREYDEFKALAKPAPKPF